VYAKDSLNTSRMAFFCRSLFFHQSLRCGYPVLSLKSGSLSLEFKIGVTNGTSAKLGRAVGRLISPLKPANLPDFAGVKAFFGCLLIITIPTANQFV